MDCPESLQHGALSSKFYKASCFLFTVLVKSLFGRLLSCHLTRIWGSMVQFSDATAIRLSNVRTT